MIKVYVANLGAYNRGFLKGKWLELPMDKQTLKSELESILAPTDEEYEIHDYECEFFKVGVYDDVYEINERAEYLEQLKEYQLEDLKAICEEVSDFEEAIEVLDSGSYTFIPNIENEKEFGEYIATEGLFGVEIPENLQNYIDYEAIGRDWMMDYSFVSGGVIRID